LSIFLIAGCSILTKTIQGSNQTYFKSSSHFSKIDFVCEFLAILIEAKEAFSLFSLGASALTVIEISFGSVFLISKMIICSTYV
jgi:hypothetical protein